VFFSEIIGQDTLKKRLIKTVSDRRISHAQLFFGPEGAGALPLAIAYAQYISCTGDKREDSCGICPSCLKYTKLIHPDLHFLFPVNSTAAKKEDPYCDDFLVEWRTFVLQNPYGRLNDWYLHIELENKQGLIKEKESDAIAKKLFFKPFESDFKITIIWMAEKMHEVASNKLLKLLEEPPDMTLFILIAENPEYLLTTIRSRCFPVHIPLIDAEDMKNILHSRHGLDADQASTVARLAMGNYASAMEFIGENEETGLSSDTFREFMLAGYEHDIVSGMKMVEALSALTREKQKAFLDYSLRILRENSVKQFQNSDLNYMNRKEEEFSVRFSKFINNSNIVPLTEEFNKAAHDIERNGNSRIILMDLLLKAGSLLRQ
jgi:DNA polymerase-3 subunit delta'